MTMNKVVILVGAGQIGMAIARRIGMGKTIVVGDYIRDNAEKCCDILNGSGFKAIPEIIDISSRESILRYLDSAKSHGDIQMLINAAGVSPSQASIEQILRIDLYGTAVLLEEVGKIIVEGGCGVTISSQSGHRMEALGADTDYQLAMTPAEDLLSLDVLQRYASCLSDGKAMQCKTCNGRSRQMGIQRCPNKFYFAGHHYHATCSRRVQWSSRRFL